MTFPATPRVMYGRNTLRQVICQVRFPSILRIESQIPDVFQEMIRESYPLFSERAEPALQLPIELAQIIPVEVRQSASGGRRHYEFSSDRKNWVITLTRETLALTSTKYTRWAKFRDHFDKPLQSLVEIYRPSFFGRVGLRYQNIIQRSALGLEGIPWSALIRPYIAGPLGADNIEASIDSAFQTFEVSLQDEVTRVRVQHGLVENEEGEQCYLIDTDLFTEQRTEVRNGLELLDGFNRRGTQLFRWCITDRLHEAMEPKAL